MITFSLHAIRFPRILLNIKCTGRPRNDYSNQATVTWTAIQSTDAQVYSCKVSDLYGKENQIEMELRVESKLTSFLVSAVVTKFLKICYYISDLICCDHHKHFCVPWDMCPFYDI